MRKIAQTASALLACLGLASCSTLNPFSSTHPSEPSAQNPTVSASNTIRPADQSGLERTLDKYDQEKMSHALDKPLGKSSEWSNPRTGVSYTVTPVAKLSYNGNPYCRRYSIVSSKGDSRHKSTGTACVSTTDSSWQVMN